MFGFVYKKHTQEDLNVINYAIHLIIKNNQIYKLKRFLKDKRIPLYDIYLASASYRGYYEICEILLKDKRIKPSKNFEALLYAARNGHIDIIRLFIKDSRFIFTTQNNYVLHEARRFGHYDIVNLLLRNYKVSILDGNISYTHIIQLLK